MDFLNSLGNAINRFGNARLYPIDDVFSPKTHEPNWDKPLMHDCVAMTENDVKNRAIIIAKLQSGTTEEKQAVFNSLLKFRKLNIFGASSVDSYMKDKYEALVMELSSQGYFRNLNLDGVHFHNLSMADLDLCGSSFKEAHLTQVDMSWAKLDGVIFNGAHLTRVVMINTEITPRTQFLNTTVSLMPIHPSSTQLEVKLKTGQTRFVNPPVQLSDVERKRLTDTFPRLFNSIDRMGWQYSDLKLSLMHQLIFSVEQVPLGNEAYDHILRMCERDPIYLKDPTIAEFIQAVYLKRVPLPELNRPFFSENRNDPQGDSNVQVGIAREMLFRGPEQRKEMFFHLIHYRDYGKKGGKKPSAQDLGIRNKYRNLIKELNSRELFHNLIVEKVTFPPGCNLSELDLSGSSLNLVDLFEADLTGTKLINARIKDTRLMCVNASDTNFNGAILDNVVTTEMKITPGTQFFDTTISFVLPKQNNPGFEPACMGVLDLIQKINPQHATLKLSLMKPLFNILKKHLLSDELYRKFQLVSTNDPVISQDPEIALFFNPQKPSISEDN